MDVARTNRLLERSLGRWGRAAAVVVLIMAALALVGWATGIQALTRTYPTWPPMTPWTALWLATLAVALLVQSGNPSPGRVWIGRSLATLVGVTAAVILVEYATSRTFGLDQMWFGDAVRRVQRTLPGRPSPQTSSSVLFLSVAAGLTLVNRPRTRVLGMVSLGAAMVMPFVAILAYLFGAVARLQIGTSTGMALMTAIGLLLLGAATVLLRPAWLIARSDRLSLVRLGIILAGFPLLVGLSRRALLALGLRDDLALTFATATGTVVLGAAAYRLSRREHVLLEAKELDRTLLRASLDGMLDPQVLLEAVRDSSGRVTDFVYREVNQATCDYLGLSREDLLGSGLQDRSPGVVEAGLFAAYVRCVDTGEPLIIDDLSYDSEILGDTRRYDLRATRATPTAITLTWRDVTDRFRVAQLLAQARDLRHKADARFRRLMDNSGIGMGLLAPDGKFEVVNEAMCKFFGYDADTLAKKTWQELTAPEFLEADFRQVEDVLAGRSESYRMTKQYIHADGHVVWGDLSVSCLRKPDGEVEYFVSQIIDITAEVEARRQLALRDEQNRLLAQRLQTQTDRLTADLRSAAAYVASVLPGGLEGQVRVSSRYLPSQELAGDCFDYRWVDDDHLIVYLIDVSGHGIEPALLSISVHNVLRSGVLPLETLLAPDQVLTDLNRLFQMERHGDHYFTMWVAVYEASTRMLRYASAGTPPAFAFNSETGTGVAITELSTHGAPVGVFKDTEFTSRTYAVPHGCRILVFSDGAHEIILDSGRQGTLTDFEKVTTRLAQTLDWTLDELVEDLLALTSTGAFSDDCSLIQLTFD